MCKNQILRTFILAIPIFLMASSAKAQWAPSSTNTTALIYRTGNVGIGITVPIAPLHVVGTTILNGNVGIGTTTPSTRFSVLGQDAEFFSAASENTLRIGINENENFEFNVGDYYAYFDYYQDDDNNSGHVFYIRNMAGGTSTSNDIRFQTQSTDRITIKGGGNIGIGTANPLAKLSVSGGDIAIGNRLDQESRYIGKHIEDGSMGAASNWVGFISTDLEDYITFGTHKSGVGGGERMRINALGNVGIGTTDPGIFKLAVEGKLGARSFKVTTGGWADYVFAPSYQLMPLTEVESYVQQNHHLPNVPSAKEVEENGFELEVMDAKLMEKIEELTLYTIQQQKLIEAQQQELQKKTEQIENILSRLEATEKNK